LFKTKLKKVREEMREIKAEYARVELQFNDFDFNNQMVEALIGEDVKKNHEHFSYNIILL
jgi:hypothetical protein